jgi:hypothetical protein
MATKDDKILEEARKRFRRVSEYESSARDLYEDDVRFANADSDNGYQWPETIREGRTKEQRPCLTINKTRQHCLQIINDARQNKPGIEVRPIGEQASYDAAKIFEGVIRHIEYISNAQQAYDTATWHQVMGGIGYWRVLTDYVSDDTFDQEIYIRRISDPLTVYLDPDIQQYDGSDARFGFVFRDMPRDEFEETYPRYKDDLGDVPLNDDGGWNDEHHIRVAEYYRKVEKRDRLLNLDTGEAVRASTIPPNVRELMPNDVIDDAREITEYEIEWYLIAGHKILERRIWPGKYIPLVRVVGEEVKIGKEMDRRGHARALKDPQRMYNYWSSSVTEYVALQTKTPYIAAAEAIEGNQQAWEESNRVARAILPYKAYNDQGQPLPAPQRVAPPAMPDAFIKGLQIAQQEMMLVSGQYQAIMGEPSNETSGKAINARQRQGDNATYHFIDHLASAVRFTGRILIDLIPKVYDTQRVLLIMAEDGSQQQVQLNPQLPVPLAQQQNPITGQVQRIFNPAVGRYEVEADIGPAYATRRQEAFNAFMQIASQNAALVGIIGDLMFKAADFPMADEISERLHNMLPPQALGGPSPQMQQMQAQSQQQIANLQKLASSLADQLTKAQIELKQKNDKSQLEVYDAETRRMAAVGNIDPEALRPIVRELVSQALGTPIVPVMAMHAAADQARQPQPDPEEAGADSSQQ